MVINPGECRWHIIYINLIQSKYIYFLYQARFHLCLAQALKSRHEPYDLAVCRRVERVRSFLTVTKRLAL